MDKLLIGFFLLLSVSVSYSQTANENVPDYNGNFRYGVNMGYYPPWSNTNLATIAAGDPSQNVEGVGVKSLRPALFEWFFEFWGYDFNLNEYYYFDYLDLKEHTAIVGYPNDVHRDDVWYCPTAQSSSFKNIYLDIWDGGLNGTPYNDDNYYAAYLYKVVSVYKDHVRFWEIWNEPDFDHSYQAWLPPGEPGNWWENNPDPCDHAFHAPVSNYIRMLRVSYEIIKMLDPDGFVCVGGLGYPSYLDAILRNTDNPYDGSISNDHPLKGGAYFDVLSFHAYPHVENDMAYWSDELNNMIYNRHSDLAANLVVDKKNEFEAVLFNHGYNGATYPMKHAILTETNIPRINVNNNLGSDDAQINFTIKALVKAQMNNIRQMYFYSIAEVAHEGESNNEFNYMGFYRNLTGTYPYSQVRNNSGTAFKTTSHLLYGWEYDKVATDDLNLPFNVDGAAFISSWGEYRYVLWAKTWNDMDEAITATYSFPYDLQISNLEEFKWDYTSNYQTLIVPSQGISLSSCPTFYQRSFAPLAVELLAFNAKVLKEDVVLDWQVSEGQEIKTFTVERSIDHENWEKIIVVDEIGERTNFEAVDEEPILGTGYYRLLMEEPDGTTSYSSIQSVTFKATDEFSVFPNPARNNLNVFVNNPEDVLNIGIYGMDGKLYECPYNLNSQTVDLNISKLRSGMYILMLTTKNGQQSKKFMVKGAGEN